MGDSGKLYNPVFAVLATKEFEYRVSLGVWKIGQKGCQRRHITHRNLRGVYLRKQPVKQYNSVLNLSNPSTGSPRLRPSIQFTHLEVLFPAVASSSTACSIVLAFTACCAISFEASNVRVGFGCPSWTI